MKKKVIIIFTLLGLIAIIIGIIILTTKEAESPKKEQKKARSTLRCTKRHLQARHSTKKQNVQREESYPVSGHNHPMHAQFSDP